MDGGGISGLFRRRCRTIDKPCTPRSAITFRWPLFDGLDDLSAGANRGVPTLAGPVRLRSLGRALPPPDRSRADRGRMGWRWWRFDGVVAVMVFWFKKGRIVHQAVFRWAVDRIRSGLIGFVGFFALDEMMGGRRLGRSAMERLETTDDPKVLITGTRARLWTISLDLVRRHFPLGVDFRASNMSMRRTRPVFPGASGYSLRSHPATHGPGSQRLSSNLGGIGGLGIARLDLGGLRTGQDARAAPAVVPAPGSGPAAGIDCLPGHGGRLASSIDQLRAARCVLGAVLRLRFLPLGFRGPPGTAGGLFPDRAFPLSPGGGDSERSGDRFGMGLLGPGLPARHRGFLLLAGRAPSGCGKLPHGNHGSGEGFPDGALSKQYREAARGFVVPLAKTMRVKTAFPKRSPSWRKRNTY